MLRVTRILWLLVVSAIAALVVPEAICNPGGWGLWAASECTARSEFLYRALFVSLSWLGVFVATMVWREDW